MNKPRIQTKKSGFTIIEVVLVLAIAGLIFLMVFLALPALQRSQRDTGRKNDVSTVVSALQSYLSNNRNSFGSGLTSANVISYVDRLGQYDKGTTTTPVDLSVNGAAGATGSITLLTTKMYVRTGVKCPASLPAPSANPTTGALQAAGSRQAVVVTALENDGTNYQAYCQDL